ncbi:MULTISPECIES: hypothetical protein [Pseudomonas]|uniref:hypothetical protein n=1 Tax=Pseudomonas TaxID=286 RepID=UPI0012FB9F5D|nr:MULTISPECIES: hypothetical protein [Pseudomonas]MDC7829804.1 hypothetical protein [Pseudomonas benzopyrenica]
MSNLNLKGAFHSSLEGDITKYDSEELQFLASVVAQVEVAGGLATRRSLKKSFYEASVSKATATSPMTECFMVLADGAVELTKMSSDGANILEAYGITFVPADGISHLHYQLVKKFNGSVLLKDMLRDNSFKAFYNQSK